MNLSAIKKSIEISLMLCLKYKNMGSTHKGGIYIGATKIENMVTIDTRNTISLFSLIYKNIYFKVGFNISSRGRFIIAPSTEGLFYNKMNLSILTEDQLFQMYLSDPIVQLYKEIQVLNECMLEHNVTSVAFDTDTSEEELDNILSVLESI